MEDAAVVVAAARASLRRVREDEGLRRTLWSRVAQFATGARGLGFDVSPDSAVFSLVIGAPEAALKASEALRERGVLVKAIRPPTVPEGTSRLRVSLSAAHTAAQVDTLLEALATLPKSKPTPAPAATTRTRQLLADDLAHVWHPFTQMQVWPDDSPVIIDRADLRLLLAELQRGRDDAESQVRPQPVHLPGGCPALPFWQPRSAMNVCPEP